MSEGLSWSPFSIPDYCEPAPIPDEATTPAENERSLHERAAEIAQRLQREAQSQRVEADEAHYLATVSYRRQAAADARNPRLVRRARSSEPDLSCDDMDGMTEPDAHHTLVKVLPAPAPPPPESLIRS